MRTFLFSLFCLLVLNSYASVSFGDAKFIFSGLVKDRETGLPIEGATIMIADEKAGASTDAQGKFIFQNISEGRHLIEISHLGYASIAEYVEIKADLQKTFLLTESIVENNAVVVTGVSKATQLKSLPFQVDVFRKADLNQSSALNFTDLLTKKAGIFSFSTGPAITKPVIRGLGYNRVLTINDGVRQEGQQWGDEHGLEIDESSVQKVEVLKGPASLVYGSDAMAGVVNIITNVPVAPNTVKMNIGSNYQSNNQFRSIYGNLSGNQNGFNWNAYGAIKAASDYQNKWDGYVLNSRFSEKNWGGYAGYNGSRGFSHVIISQFNQMAGLIEGVRDSIGRFIYPVSGAMEIPATEAVFKNTRPLFPYQHIRHFKIATDNSIRLGVNKLTFNMGYQQNKREEFGNPDDPEERELFFNLKTFTYNARFLVKEQKGWKHSFGINGMYQQNFNLGAEQLIPDYRLNDQGIYFYTQKEIRKWNWSGGIRFDNRNVHAESLKDGSLDKSPAFMRSFSNYSGSIGIAYAIRTGINLKLNSARSFRAPGLSELASNGAHEGTIRYEYGDKNLKSEVAWQNDIALEWSKTHFSLNVAAYHNRFNNFIFYRKLLNVSGADSMVDNGGGEMLTAFRFDQQQATLSGIEVTLDIHPHPLDWLHFENNFSFVRGKLKQALESSSNLPFIPAPRLISDLRADVKKINKHIGQVYLKLEMENSFTQKKIFSAYNTETITDAYSLLNISTGATFSNNKKQHVAQLNISLNNLLDVSYQNHLSRLKYTAVNPVTGRSGVFNMGRNFSIRLNVPLEWKLHS